MRWSSGEASRNRLKILQGVEMIEVSWQIMAIGNIIIVKEGNGR